MSSSNPNLKELLAQLQKHAGLMPPTPAEADAAMAGSEEAAFDDDRLLRIAEAVIRGEPAKLPIDTPESWSEENQLSDVEREQFALNRNCGELDDETKKKIDEAEKKALSDDEDSDDEDGVDGQGDPS
jgi:hypothetical protein